MSDGTIKIDTKIETRGFDAGMKRLQSSALTAMNNILLTTLKAGIKINDALSRVGNIFKKVLLGAALLFALNIRNIFAGLRETIQDAISLKGGDTQNNFENLKNSFVELKMSIAAAFLPLVEFAIPYIQLAVNWLIEFFNKVAMITAALTGQKEVMQVIVGSAAKLAKNTEKAKKEAQGALAAFDQINVLQQKTPGAETNAPKVETQMVPISDEVINKIANFKQWLIDTWNWIKETWGTFYQWWIDTVWNPVMSFVLQAWNIITATISAAWQDIQAVWGVAYGWWIENVWNPIMSWALQTWEYIKLGAALAWEDVKAAWGIASEWWKILWAGIVTDAAGAWIAIMTVWQDAKTWFITTVLDPIRNAFSVVLDWISTKWHTVFTGLQDFVKGTINAIIDYINRMINALVGGINQAVNAVNAVASGIGGAPVLAGISAVAIPHLASGAVIPPNNAFAAVLGDQKSGRNLEAPESLIRQIIREEMGGGNEVTVPITLTLDSDVVWQGQQRVQRQRGTSLASGGVVR